jgi:choice-of-anchor C domain-containing protein
MTRLICGFFLLLLGSATWGANLLQNGSFELGADNPCFIFDIPAGSTLITGWTVSVGTIDWYGPAPCGWAAANGGHSLDLVGQAGIGGIQQTFDTVPGRTYRLSFALAGNYDAPPVIKPLAVTIDGVTTNFTFDTTGRNRFNLGWVRQKISFVATSSTTTVNFVSDVRPSGGTLNAGAAIDNVRVKRSKLP